MSTTDVGSRCKLNSVHYPRSFGSLSALSQCNWQIRKELKQFSTSPGFAKAAVNELDVMIDSSSVYPTWTILAHTEMRRMEHLRVNLRIMNMMPEYGRPFSGDGGPGNGYRWLFDLLRRLLHHGPTFIGIQSIRHELFLKKVTIDVSFDDDQRMISQKTGKPIDIGSQEQSRERLVRRITIMLRMVLAWGLLHGRVARLHVSYKTLTRDFEVPEVQTERQQIMGERRRYGFGWGPDEK